MLDGSNNFQRIDIRHSIPKRLIALAFLLAFSVRLSLTVFNYSLPFAYPRGNYYFDLVALIFVGICAMAIAWSLNNGRRLILTISDTGISDSRISEDFIPWQSISKIYGGGYGYPILTIQVHPERMGLLSHNLRKYWEDTSSVPFFRKFTIQTGFLDRSTGEINSVAQSYLDQFGSKTIA